jgi:serine protease Do
MARTVKDAILEKGKVERGRIGVLIQNLTEELAASFGYDSTDGILVGDVIPDSPAAKAGLRVGDIIVELDGKEVTKAHELRNRVAATSPGSEATLRIFRDGDYQEVTIQIGRLEDAPAMVAAGDNGREEVAEELGITAENLTPEKRQQLGLETDETGVVVTGVQRGSVAHSKGIRVGDLIVAIDDAQVSNLNGFRSALENADLTKGVRMQIKRDGVRRFVFLKQRS